MAAGKISTLQKIAWAYAILFLGVYSLDYVPGIMDANGKMFGLFSMTPLVDAGHLALGALAVICALISKKAARCAPRTEASLAFHGSSRSARSCRASYSTHR